MTNSCIGKVLERWRDLQVATQQRYLESTDPDGETAYAIAQRGERSAATRLVDFNFRNRSENLYYIDPW
jgi:hypothetical protein